MALRATVINVIKLGVEQVALADRPDLYFSGNPICTTTGHFFLLQAVGKLQIFVFNFEGFFFGFVGVKRLDEAQQLDAVKFFALSLIRINGEVD